MDPIIQAKIIKISKKVDEAIIKQEKLLERIEIILEKLEKKV